jgi:hypothetical protein
MPQPDSSRSTHDRYHESNGTWPLDPAATRRFASHMAGRPARPKEEPEKDGRTPQDPDGNEELERQEREAPSSRRTSTERGALSSRSRSDESDTGSWTPQPFTLDDELEDTWPNVPTPYLDD